MQTYKHKTILITGASSGIGAAMACQLADPTVTLLLTARSTDQLQTLSDELAATGAQTAVFPHDLSTPDAATELHNQITDTGFTIDVLINNAGFGKQGPFENIDVDTYAAMIGLNVTNLVTLTRHCVPAMLEHDDAGILNVSSTAGFQPFPYFAVYAATKSFVTRFSEALHGECSNRGLTVSCLCPGPTKTHFQEQAGTDMSFPRSFESPEKVAHVGLRALLDNRMTTVSGIANAAGALLGRFAPRRAVVALMRQAFRSTAGE